jgi:hypothetical protein
MYRITYYLIEIPSINYFIPSRSGTRGHNIRYQGSNLPFTIKKTLSRNVQLKTKKWKLWKAGVCQAMTEDVNGA